MIVVIMASWSDVRTPQTLVWEKAFYPWHRADAEWLRAVARVCIWLVHSISTRDISQYAFLLGLLCLSNKHSWGVPRH